MRLSGGIWLALPLALLCLAGCSGSLNIPAGVPPEAVPVAVAAVGCRPLARQLTISSELVPFQEIDVYAKESGYVKQLLVDYGTRVAKGQLLAVLDIPELEVLIDEDTAGIQAAVNKVNRVKHEVSRLKAQHEVCHLQAARLSGVMETRPGLVAQQEVDDAQGKDLASEAQVEAGLSSLQMVEGERAAAQAKAQRDRVLLDYSRVTAPFSGIITQRYANLGTLVQAGTNSSTQVLPIARLSQDDLFRLVIPVPETAVRYIRTGDEVQVRIPSLNRTFRGRVTRFSVDVSGQTRTMHTEVDVPNPSHVLVPGLYAEATLTLERKDHALVLPFQAVDQAGGYGTVLRLDGNRCLRQRTVKLGLQGVNEMEVTSGLNEGDLVVFGDRTGLRSGMEVAPKRARVLGYQGEREP